MTARRIDLVVAACFCGAIGLYDTLYVVFMLSGGPVIGPSLTVLFPDFLVFHAAARAWFECKLALVYDIDAFTAFQNAIYSDRFPGEVHFRPFFYPPVWLLTLLPFGLLGVAKAYGVFMAATAALATALEGRRDIWGWLAVITSPAAVWVVLAGQNTFLSVALAVAAVWFAFRRQGTSDARTAVLVTATFLVSPYTLNYDLLLLMPAAVALFRRGVAEGFYPLERLVYLALWLIPTFGMILNRLDLPVMPSIVLLFGAIAWARLVTAPKVELPSAATAR
jgi:hypothetical protein